MKRLIGFMITGVIILAIGLAVGLNLHPGSKSVASAQEGPMIDGQVQPDSDFSIPDEVTAPANPLFAATLYRSYAANEFHTTHSNLTFASYGPALYALAIPGGGFSFKLPIDLPNGSTVTRITVYFVDNDDTHNMSFQFYRVRLSNATQIELDSVSTTGLPSSTAVQSVSMTGTPIAVLDYSNYAYAIRYAPVIIGSGHQMVGVRFEYQNPVTAFLPLLNK